MGHPNCYLSEPEVVIQFVRSQYSVKGSMGYAEVTVVRGGANAGLSQVTTCDYYTKDKTAVDGKDYEGESNSLAFANGETKKVKIGEIKSNHPLGSQIGKKSLICL